MNLISAGLGDRFRGGNQSRTVTTHSGQFSQATPPWEMQWMLAVIGPLLSETNSEFRAAVASNAGIVDQLVKDTGC